MTASWCCLRQAPLNSGVVCNSSWQHRATSATLTDDGPSSRLGRWSHNHRSKLLRNSAAHSRTGTKSLHARSQEIIGHTIAQQLTHSCTRRDWLLECSNIRACTCFDALLP
ncbi:TPA: hypothetical protein ACH3X2_008169 [Trebouxia sp. C0005]